MKVETRQVTKHTITEVKGLDPITVICEDIAPREGKIIIECYGKSWSGYWGGMGELMIGEFICSCDEHYIANKISDIDAEVYDLDAILKMASDRGMSTDRDDPWNDHELMIELYGVDIMDWNHKLPTMANPEYTYLCRIIKAVKKALKSEAKLP